MEKTKKDNLNEVAESSIIDRATLSKADAADYIRNYFRKMGGLSKTIGEKNTRFLFIKIKSLVDIINDWNGTPLIDFVEGTKPELDSIRIYPMIYKKDYKDPDRRNMFNLCLVPVLGENEIIDKNKLRTFANIANEIGQCPPGKHCEIGSAQNNGLLAAVLNLGGSETSE